MAVRRTAQRRGIRVYHGGPHKFDRFSTRKIGSGEGAQSFGWGLYFAGDHGIARGYQKRLSGRDNIRPSDEAVAPFKRRWERLNAMGRKVDPMILSGDKAKQKAGLDLFDRINAQRDKLHSRFINNTLKAKPWLERGAFYEARLKARASQLLDWDKPFERQPRAVQNAFRKLLNTGLEPGYRFTKTGTTQTFADLMKDPPDAEGWQFFKRWQDKGLVKVIGRDEDLKGKTGKDLYESLSGRFATGERFDMAKRASLMLYREGVKGVQYLDSNSRDGDGADGDNKRNYVMFSGRDVEIVRREALTRDRMPRGSLAAANRRLLSGILRRVRGSASSRPSPISRATVARSLRG